MFTSLMLRALGEGVRSLHKGDLVDVHVAHEVVRELKVLGYTLSGHKFVRTTQLIVTSHFHEKGVNRQDLTDEERERVRALINLTEYDLFNLPEMVADVLGNLIRDLRVTKKLKPDPEGL